MFTKIEKEIKELREELYRVSKGRSFSDPEVVSVSQKIDGVLYEYWISDILKKYSQ